MSCCDGGRVVDVSKTSFGRPRRQADGSMLYKKRGVEPPPDLDGYNRDPQNFWRFIPKWNQCDFRNQTEFVRRCGSIGLISLCTHPEGQGKEVTYTVCAKCPLTKTK